MPITEVEDDNRCYGGEKEVRLLNKIVSAMISQPREAQCLDLL